MGVSIITWLRILSTNHFRIHPAFWLRTLFITLTSLLSIPFQLVEYLIYSRRINKQKVVAPVFIIGQPRSGTTHLFNLMAKDEQFGYCNVFSTLLPHVFLIGGGLFRKMISSALPKTRPQDNVKMTIGSPKEEEFAMVNMSNTSYLFGMFFPRNARMNFDKGVLFKSVKDKEHWQRHYQYYLKKMSFSTGKRLLLKSPANLARTEAILELFPDAKFIHIHRNPLEVFQSTEHLYEKVVPLTSFQNVDNVEMKKYILYSYRSMYAKYFSAAELLSDKQLVTVTYNELIEAPMKTIQRIYSALDLSTNNGAFQDIDQEINLLKGYKNNEYSVLNEKDRIMLQEGWGQINDKLGYPSISSSSDLNDSDSEDNSALENKSA